MATHELKTWPKWFEMVRSGRKLFELRVNDRNYQCGDTLILREWEPKTEIYTGSEERRVVADIIDLSPLYECVALVFMDDASDTLRAQLAAANEELRRRHCYPLRGQTTAEAIKMAFDNGDSYLESVLVRAKRAEADRDALAARVAELEEALGDLREAMERAKASVWDGHYGKGITVDYARAVDKEISEATSKADKALARTPAQSLARVQAAALREAANSIAGAAQKAESNACYSSGAYEWDDAVGWLRMEADRLEAEAANG